MRTQIVRAKVTLKTKQQAEEVLKKLGLYMSDVINLLLIQIHMHKQLPFEITLPKIPNEKTRKELEATERGKDLIENSNIEEMFKTLGLDK